MRKLFFLMLVQILNVFFCCVAFDVRILPVNKKQQEEARMLRWLLFLIFYFRPAFTLSDKRCPPAAWTEMDGESIYTPASRTPTLVIVSQRKISLSTPVSCFITADQTVTSWSECQWCRLLLKTKARCWCVLVGFLSRMKGVESSSYFHPVSFLIETSVTLDFIKSCSKLVV